MNDNLIPYVPINDRVQATSVKSQLLCQQLFKIIDQCVIAQFSFNHDTEKGFLSIAPDQINDLLLQLSESEHLEQVIDIKLLEHSLKDLIYPKFTGEHTVTSPIWNNTEVRVWQFQLNQIVQRDNMQHIDDAELNLDMALSSLRVWRNALEAAGNDRDVICKNNDLIYKLMDIEQRLDVVQKYLEQD